MILESMKMEIPIVAPVAGTIKEFLVKEGEVVQEGQTVAIIEEPRAAVTSGMAANPPVRAPREGVLRLTINDPERRNPLSSELFRAIESELRGVANGVRLV